MASHKLNVINSGVGINKHTVGYAGHLFAVSTGQLIAAGARAHGMRNGLKLFGDPDIRVPNTPFAGTNGRRHAI